MDHLDIAAAILAKLGESRIEITDQDVDELKAAFTINGEEFEGGYRLTIFAKPDPSQPALMLVSPADIDLEAVKADAGRLPILTPGTRLQIDEHQPEFTSMEIASLAASLMNHSERDVRRLAASCLTQAHDKPDVFDQRTGVQSVRAFSRSECIFHYCPHPAHCTDAAGGCISPQKNPK